MKRASDFYERFQGNWAVNAAVFTREEVNALRKHDHITETTARILLELYYDPVRDLHDTVRVFHRHHDSVPYDKESLMDLKRIANKYLETDNAATIRIKFTGEEPKDVFKHPEFVKYGTLYIDVDDTILAENWRGSGFDLRPWVMTQIRVLSQLFDLRWLTCWGEDKLKELFQRLNCGRYWQETTYCEWFHRSDANKADKLEAVLDGPPNWYWLEDPLCKDDVERLKFLGQKDRYISVSPTGPWGFTEACQKLFFLVGVTDKDIFAVDGHPDWFKVPTGTSPGTMMT